MKSIFKEIKWHISTCDSLSYILKPYSWLMDKYISEVNEVIVLGYNKFPELSSKYKCISLSDSQKSLNEWTRNLYNYFVHTENEFVLFTLEDLLPIRSIDYNILNTSLELMAKDKTIGRYELGTGHCWHKDEKLEKIDFRDFKIYKYGYNSLYRISTQTSIWRTEYLLKYLNHNWTPWDFEVQGSKIAQNDGMNIIATENKYALEWVHSALSSKYPNMINVHGITKIDVEEMIYLGLFERDRLQLGIELNSPRYE